LGFYFLVATNAKDTLLVHVIDDTVDDTPANEIQLCNRRRKSLKLDPLCTTKRVKKLFRVAVK
jgi:hypothetical protein